MDSSPRPVSVGDVLAGRYTIVRALGEGGMALVFEGEHVRLGQRVAIKLIRAELAAHAELIARFEREGRAASKLRSRHAARIFDVDVTDAGVPFLTMELLSGNDLAAELERRGVLPIAEAVAHVMQACDALAEAHALGIVHRDVKPSNLFLTTEGTERIIKVLDFGIATSPLDDDGRLTRTGAVMGTPIYMAPEQFRSAKGVDARADVWSLGATLFELISGRPPFEGSAATVGIAIVGDALPSIHELRADVPEGLAAAIARALEKDREARFQTVTELRDAIAPFAIGAATGEPANAADPGRSSAVVSRDAATVAARDVARSVAEVAHTEIALTAATPAPTTMTDGRRRYPLLALVAAASAATVIAALAWPRHAPAIAPGGAVAEASSTATSAPPAPTVIAAPPPSAAPTTGASAAGAAAVPPAIASARGNATAPLKGERVAPRPPPGTTTTPTTATKPPLFYPGN
jgi:serine/threonine-protein kinase